MGAAVLFWVLVVVDPTPSHTMFAQQFVSAQACEEAKQFILGNRANNVFVRCIQDKAPSK